MSTEKTELVIDSLVWLEASVDFCVLVCCFEISKCLWWHRPMSFECIEVCWNLLMKCQSVVNYSSQVCWRKVNLQELWLKKEEEDGEFDGCLHSPVLDLSGDLTPLWCLSTPRSLYWPRKNSQNKAKIHCRPLSSFPTNRVLDVSNVKMIRFGYRVDLTWERYVRVKDEAKIASRWDWDDIIAEK